MLNKKRSIPTFIYPLLVFLGIIFYEIIQSTITGDFFIDPSLENEQIIVWLLSHKPLQILIIGVSSIVLILFLLKDIGISSIGKDGVSFKSKKEFQITLMSDFLMILNYHAEMKDTLSYMELIGIFEEQMSEADKTILEISGMLKRKFLEILKPRLPKEISIGESKEYNVFIRCEREVEEILRRLYRRSFKENHLDQFSDEGFLSYTGEKLQRFFELAENVFEDLNIYSTLSEDSDLKTLLTYNRELAIIFQKTFFTARRLGIKKNAYKISEREKFHSILLDFFKKYGIEIEKEDLLTKLFPMSSNISSFKDDMESFDNLKKGEL